MRQKLSHGEVSGCFAHMFTVQHAPDLEIVPFMWHLIWWQHDLTKAIPMRAQEEKRRATEEALASESSYDIAERMLVETGMLKALAVRCEMEVRSMLLERAGQVSLLIKWQGTWLTCALVFCGR